MNITYLFGAGASKNAIPINDTLLASMHLELQNIKEEFKKNQIEICNESRNPFITQSLIDDFVSDYSFILNEGLKHQSIDTYAKKLYITQDFPNLKKLKTILSIYFIIIQSRRSSDERYDSFFASILEESKNIFPNNLKILSWNYDYQFEKAYSIYCGDSRLSAIFSYLKVYSKNTRLNYVDNENFGIFKLNGTAAFMLNENDNKLYQSIEDINDEYNAKLIRNILGNYASLHHLDKTKNNLISTISFAWEDYNSGKFIVKKAIEFTENTDILVVIGYSFPFFNRKVDRDILRGMNQLKKVYFQAPDAENLRERFLAVRDDINKNDLLIRTDLKQFVFPNEF
jgi:hypothetical protein